MGGEGMEFFILYVVYCGQFLPTSVANLEAHPAKAMKAGVRQLMGCSL